MIPSLTGELTGTHGRIATRTWPNLEADHLVLLAHGYGEHVGRYEHVAQVLVEHGAEVWALDHTGHGLSDGDRAVIPSFEDVVTDLHQLADEAVDARPDLPIALVGHSMGGLIAARYAQRYPAELDALVLSAPVLGRWAAVEHLLSLEEVPDDPLDVTTLSRDPAVGQAYSADELVWHGKFQRPMLEALQVALETVNAGPVLGDLPTLWLHGGADQLVPIEDTRTGIAHIRGTLLEELTYPGARHEVFNETNKDEVLDDVTDFLDRALGLTEPDDDDTEVEPQD
ncbi:lysophospholipase [Rhodococcus antarcticus]|jgi:alpha-beta hydrolase superfamily lysophospholipase|uniref:Lysophospholipase n=1 Tax=Rhodococcus antarcticus TaxID=2987751 RepID=A0ABY6NZZ5_9NOCA|nr:alpha/beta hydrolase [Rhodococcus antarcticus]UZJ24858.1 lysophospholipase [Rhodococcus antarcticus]